MSFCSSPPARTRSTLESSTTKRLAIARRSTDVVRLVVSYMSSVRSQITRSGTSACFTRCNPRQQLFKSLPVQSREVRQRSRTTGIVRRNRRPFSDGYIVDLEPLIGNREERFGEDPALLAAMPINPDSILTADIDDSPVAIFEAQLAVT